MDALNGACLFVAGACLVVITVIIPYGVFCRYVLNSAASWPEPMAVLLMIVLSFLSAVVCYREHLHIGVGLLPNALSGRSKVLLGWVIELVHARHQRVHALVRHQAHPGDLVPEHRRVPAGLRGRRLPADPHRRRRSRCCS